MSIREFIEQEVPPPVLGMIPFLFLKGHKLATEVIKETPCLQIPSVQLGDIRAAAIDFVMHGHFKKKNYPGITTGYSSFHRPTGKYFAILTEESRITISHIPHIEDFPRTAEFRKNARRGNAPFLFSDMEAARKREEAAELDCYLRKHLLITYGDQNLEFLQIGMQAPGEPQAWIEPPVDLLRLPHIVVDNDQEDDTEATKAKIPMNLKEEFIQHFSEKEKNAED